MQLVGLLALTRLAATLALFILGQTGAPDRRGIHFRAGLQRHAAFFYRRIAQATTPVQQ